MLTVYRASAGAGKTHTLTGEYLKMLFGGGGKDPDAVYRHILAVTFTNKATAEMKDRIIRELYTLASGQPSGHMEMLAGHTGAGEGEVRTRARTLLVRMLHDYAAFNVSTIDHFFQQTLRAFVREIGLQGNYRVELDVDPVLTKAVDGLLSGLDRDGGDSELLRWLLRFSEDKVERGETWDLRKQMSDLGRELFKERYKSVREAVGGEASADRERSAEYSRRLYAVINAVKSEARELGERALRIMKKYGLRPEDFSGKSRSPFTLFNKLAKGEVEKEPTQTFLKLPDNPEAWGKEERILQAYADGLNVCVKEVIRFYETRITDYLTAAAIAANFYTLGILGDIEREIRRQSEDKNYMLLSDTAELLTRIIDGSDVPFIYEKTGTRIRHYLIDEFQDTSAMQWRNFRPLVADSLAAGYTDLIVGDVKQSIYRFRNSDWTLLDEQIARDFPADLITERTLSENWRSRRHVVEFNNAFFTFYPARLQEWYNEGLEQSTLSPERRALYSSRILRAYAQCKQALSPLPEPNAGHVRVEWLANDSEETKWKERAMERLLDVLRELRRHGRTWGEIAVLTRTREEGALVTDTLLAYGRMHPEESLRIISDDGLLIEGAASVRFIVGMLRYMNHSDDETLRRTVCLLRSAMCIKRMGDTACPSLSDTPIEEADADEPLLSGHRSLYEAVEVLCRRFAEDFPEDELIFVQAFLDLAVDYSEREGSDIERFLGWWKDTGHKAKISTPDAPNAVRIMTIHKAKGLGFGVVILPFGDWKLDAKADTILWCHPRIAPYDVISAVPINYKKELSRTIFAEEYYHEKLHAYIDGLNALYVALTRAKEELIILAPEGKNQKNKPKEPSVPTIVKILREVLPLMDAGCEPKAGQCFEWGTWVNCEPPERLTAAGKTSVVRSLPSVRPDERMYLRLSGHSFDDTQRDYGVLMHDLLSHIRTADDLPSAIAAKVSAGEIDRQSATALEMRMRALLNEPTVRTWFDGSMTVLTEAEILSGDGRSRRPDRIMLSTASSDRRAVIVDYKFGQRESRRYVHQIRDYMALMRAMGYTDVRGCLWYVERGEIEEVSEM